MSRWWCYVVVVASAIVGCSTPQPRAAEQIMSAPPPKRPGWVERLQLSEHKAQQVTILATNVREEFAVYNISRLKLLDEVLAEIKNGVLERAKLAPLAEQTIHDFEQVLPVLLDNLNKLHALLSPEERQRLLDLLGGKENDDEAERRAERQDRIAQVLDLNSAQKAQLYPSWLGIWLGHLGLMNGLQRDVKDARKQFASEVFDARELSLIKNLRAMDLMEICYDALTTTLPILTAAQRTSLAAYLDRRVR